MDVLASLAKLLTTGDIQKRLAAAVVVAELKPKDPKIIAALEAVSADPIDALAIHALEALQAIGSAKSLPALLAAFERGGPVRKSASDAIAALGSEVLAAIKERSEKASPELRAAYAQLLAQVGGKQSFKLALDGLYGQPFEAANKVALTVRHELKDASEAEKKALAAQVEKFLAAKKTLADEPALRAAIKVLGFLEQATSTDILVPFTAPPHPAPVRIDAITALRFGLAKGLDDRKVLRLLIGLISDADGLVQRAARDTLSTIKLGEDVVPELAKLAAEKSGEVALWAIGRLAQIEGESASKALAAITTGRDRGRARQAAQALAPRPGGDSKLVDALANAPDEGSGQLLSEILIPIANKLAKKDVQKLAKAGDAALADSIAMGRRLLDPVRHADAETWTAIVRAHAEKAKKDAGRAESLWALACESARATDDDRFQLARLQLLRGSKDPHPKARAKDPALAALARLVDDGYALAPALQKDKAIDDDARYYLGFHFVEARDEGHRQFGAALLQALVKANPRAKVGKAAKNKLALSGL